MRGRGCLDKLFLEWSKLKSPGTSLPRRIFDSRRNAYSSCFFRREWSCDPALTPGSVYWGARGGKLCFHRKDKEALRGSLPPLAQNVGCEDRIPDPKQPSWKEWDKKREDSKVNILKQSKKSQGTHSENRTDKHQSHVQFFSCGPKKSLCCRLLACFLLVITDIS